MSNRKIRNLVFKSIPPQLTESVGPFHFSSTQTKNLLKDFQLSIQQIFMLKKLTDYYTVDNNVESFIKFRQEKKSSSTSISLRLIDWYLVNFLKSRRMKVINNVIYKKYQSKLKHYSKALFDVFSRGSSCLLQDPRSKEYIVTCPAQLHFFQFYQEYSIEKSINENLHQIKVDMRTKLSRNRSDKRLTKKRKRSVLTYTPTNCFIQQTDECILFDNR